jgi:hypothetical protein
MERTVLLVSLNDRKQTAVTFQKILTDWGCMVKTRLGIHDGVLNKCSNSGLVILDIVGQKKKLTEMTRKLNLVKGIKAKLVTLN